LATGQFNLLVERSGLPSPINIRQPRTISDQGRSEAAIECLRKMLQVAPDYIDAVFNLALRLQRGNECRGGRLLAPLSRYRRPIGMGYPRTPITEIL
jgi:hypothetical protein